MDLTYETIPVGVASRIVGQPGGERRLLLNHYEDVAAAVAALQALAARGEWIELTIGRISDYELAFLRELPFLKSLSLVRWPGNTLKHLSACQELTTLHLSDDFDAFDLAALPKLEALAVGEWSKRLTGLGQLSRLRSLCLYGTKGKDLTSLDLPLQLRSLTLLVTSLESLSGIERLEFLRSLRVAHARKLHDLAGLAMVPALRRLEFTSVKKMDNYEWLPHCSGLMQIELDGCAPLPTISWIRSFQQLYVFILKNTPLVDQDLSPLLSLDQLLWVDALPGRAVGPTGKEIMQHFNERRAGLGFGTTADAIRVGKLPQGLGTSEEDWAAL